MCLQQEDKEWKKKTVEELLTNNDNGEGFNNHKKGK